MYIKLLIITMTGKWASCEQVLSVFLTFLGPFKPGAFGFKDKQYIYNFIGCCLHEYTGEIISTVFEEYDFGNFVLFLEECSSYDDTSLNTEIFRCLVKCLYKSAELGNSSMVEDIISQSIDDFVDLTEDGYRSIDLIKTLISRDETTE